MNSLVGIWSDRPLGGNSGRRGVTGVVISRRPLSSFEVRRDRSPKLGREGILIGVLPPSESDRRLLDFAIGDGPRAGKLLSGLGTSMSRSRQELSKR